MRLRKIAFAAALVLGSGFVVSAYADEFPMRVERMQMAHLSDAGIERGSADDLGEARESWSERGAARARVGESPDRGSASTPADTVGDAAPPAGETVPAGTTRVPLPAAAPAVPQKPRTGNRWQSLVPGAMK